MAKLLEDIIKELEEIKKLQKEVGDQMQQTADTLKKSQPNSAKGMRDQIEAQTDLVKIQQDYIDLKKQEAVIVERARITLAKSTKQLIEEAIANEEALITKRKLNKEIKDEAVLRSKSVNEIDKARVQLRQLAKEYENMVFLGKENTEEGKKLNKMFIDLSTSVTKAEHSVNNFKGQVGKYGIVVEGVTKNIGDLKRELIALRNTSLQGKSEAEIKALNKRIGETEDALSDLKAQQKAFGMEFGAAIAGSLKFVAAGVEGVVGSMQLLGMGSESAEKAQKSLMGLIAVTQALGEIEDVLQKKTLQVTAMKIKDAAVTAKDTATKWLNVTATNAMAGKTNIFSKALGLITSPLGLVTVGVAALGFGIYKLIDSFSKSSAEAKAFTETLQEGLKSSAKERIELDLLGDKITKLDSGTKQYKAAIDELNSKYSESIGYTVSYSASHEDLARAIDYASEAMIRKAQQEAILNKLTELYQTRIDKAAENTTYWGDAMDYTSQSILSTSSSLEDVDEEIAIYEKLAKGMNSETKKAASGFDSLDKALQLVYDSQKKLYDQDKKKQDALTATEKAAKDAADKQKEAQEKANEEYAKLLKERADLEAKYGTEKIEKAVTYADREIEIAVMTNEALAEQRQVEQADMKQGLSETEADQRRFSRAWYEMMKETIEKNKQELLILNDFFADTAGQILDILSTFSDIRLQQLDDEIDKQQTAIDKAQEFYDAEKELAEAGLASDIDIATKRLAAEKAQQAELLKERKKAANQARQLKKGELTIDWISELGKIALNSTALGPVAAPIYNAIQAALATGRYIAGLATIGAQKFSKGTEGVTGGVPGQDSVFSLLTPGEKVFTVNDSKKINKLGVKNNAVPDLVAKGLMLDQMITGSSDGRVISHLSKMVGKQSEANELLTLMAGRVSADGKYAIDHKGNIKRLV